MMRTKKGVDCAKSLYRIFEILYAETDSRGRHVFNMNKEWDVGILDDIAEEVNRCVETEHTKGK